MTCWPNQDPLPDEASNFKTRADLQSSKANRIIMPYWIEHKNSTAGPVGKDCYSKRKNDKLPDCENPCGGSVKSEDCRIAACPAGSVMVRREDASSDDRLQTFYSYRTSIIFNVSISLFVLSCADAHSAARGSFNCLQQTTMGKVL